MPEGVAIPARSRMFTGTGVLMRGRAPAGVERMRSMTPEKLTMLFSKMSPEAIAATLVSLSPEELADVLARLDPRVLAKILVMLPPNVLSHVLDNLPDVRGRSPKP